MYTNNRLNEERNLSKKQQQRQQQGMNTTRHKKGNNVSAVVTDRRMSYENAGERDDVDKRIRRRARMLW
jgi:hypothetical protein